MPGYDYKTVSKNITSVLTGEIWELSKFGDLAVIAKVKNIDGLPNPELQVHEVVYRNKTLRFPKYANTSGEITFTLIEGADSDVRSAIYENIETKLKDGVVADNSAVLGDIELKAYKNIEKVARTYTLKGCIVTAIEDNLTFAEEDGQPVEITITVAFTDYEIKFNK